MLNLAAVLIEGKVVQLIHITTVMILWWPLYTRFDINSPAEIYEIHAKNPLFGSLLLQALLFQQTEYN